jgi:hypothetical protein
MIDTAAGAPASVQPEHVHASAVTTRISRKGRQARKVTNPDLAIFALFARGLFTIDAPSSWSLNGRISRKERLVKL